MGTFFTHNIPVGTTGETYSMPVTDRFYFNEDEEYKTNPQVYFYIKYRHVDWGWITVQCQSVYYSGLPTPNDNRFYTMPFTWNNQGYIRLFYDNVFQTNWVKTYFVQTVQYEGQQPETDIFQGLPYLTSYADASIVEIQAAEFSTNFPIFENWDTYASNYVLNHAGFTNALNYKANPLDEPESKEFTINNVWTNGTWTTRGLTSQGSPSYRLVKGKITTGAKISFYKKEGIVNGALQYGVITSGSIIGIEYSTDGVVWHDSEAFPFDYFYRERENELGTFDFGLSFYADIPVFEDQTTAQKYINDDPSVSEKDAINWPQISGQYPITNTTGSSLPASVFGDVKLKGFFSQQYICDSTCLAAIANDLFDTSSAGLWEDFKKGMEAWGASPIEAVMGLSFWPFSVSDFVGAGNYAAAQYIWFGGYGWATTGHGVCNHIIHASGYKDIGTIRIVPTFNSWRDFEPYSKLYVSIPYCGTYQLDLARYLGKDVRARYFIDTRTNGCICALIADGYLMDYFNGQMGVTMPITLTDYSAYMNAQMQVLLQGGGQAASTFGNAAGTVGGLAPLGNVGMAAGGAVAASGAALSGAVIGAKTVYGLTQNNINNFNKTKGGSSSMLNCYLPQTVDFIFEIQESCEPSNYNEMFGVPSMAQGVVGNFTGFLKCQSVKVNAGKATEREKERIKQMLLSGIYI